jgi:hypothetical protein
MAILATASHGDDASWLSIVAAVFLAGGSLVWIRWRLARARRRYGGTDANSAPPPATAGPPIETYVPATNEPARRGLRGWASSVFGTLVALAFAGFAVYAIANSSYELWMQRTGTPAQVKIAHCASPRLHSNGWSVINCTAAWAQPDGTQKTVNVHGPKIAVPMKVDVHIRGDQAYTDGSWPWRNLLTGIVGLAIATWMLWPRRRSGRRRRQRISEVG